MYDNVILANSTIALGIMIALTVSLASLCRCVFRVDHTILPTTVPNADREKSISVADIVNDTPQKQEFKAHTNSDMQYMSVSVGIDESDGKTSTASAYSTPSTNTEFVVSSLPETIMVVNQSVATCGNQPAASSIKSKSLIQTKNKKSIRNKLLLNGVTKVKRLNMFGKLFL